MIPRILHYCFGMTRDFGGRPWSLMHYVCLRSAVEHLRPARVNFYCQYEPKGPWWALTREFVNVVSIRAPRAVYGNAVLHYAHRADIVRLEKLIEHGGIYLDADVLVHRSFDDLLEHSVVLGMEGEGLDRGLCNAVMLAEQNAPFLKRWHAEYRSFRSKGPGDEFWVEHSVHVPARLAREFPEEILVLPQTSFYSPNWDGDGLQLIFHSAEPLRTQGYATHLWENLAWERYLKDLSPGTVRSVDTNFHRWARPYLGTLPDSYARPSAADLAGRRFRAAVGRQLPSALRDRIKRMLAG
jgi:hypothetical protein